MRPIGGEIEQQKIEYTPFFTDSGRSSLRLFFRSADYKHKKVLIPDFLCDIIVDILKQEQIEYDFYSINEKLGADVESIKSKDFDILYIIHYFGNITTLNLPLNDKILIEDYVFHYQFENRLNHPQWFAFNSFRKVMPVTDGSVVKTNLPIDAQLIEKKEAPFVKLKQEGKQIKYDYIYSNKYSETLYLQNFEKGEDILNQQAKIYSISDISLMHLLNLDNQKIQNIRKERYELLEEEFTDSIQLLPQEFSFFVLYLNNRDILRKQLMQKNIFLAIHWKSNYVDNNLENNILSIPLFENISDKDFAYLVETIKETLQL